MSEPTLNVLEANQQIGQLKHELRTEKEARAAVQSDLEAANTAHLDEVKALKDAHATELTTLKGNHAKEITDLTDKLDAANSNIEELKGEAKTADQKAAEIAAQNGGEPADTDTQDTDHKGPVSEDELKELYAKQAAIVDPVAKRQFYVDHIKPAIERK